MNTNWRIDYYISPSGDNPVKQFLDSLEKIQKAKVFRIFMYYEQYGISSIIPHTKKLSGTPFWEIRIRGKDNIRIPYLVNTEKSILVIHGFIKKTQKTPQKELYIAYQRYKEWKKRLDKQVQNDII